MGSEVNLYKGITLITADDKTPKRERKGNYWHKLQNSRYSKTVSIETYNRKIAY